MDFYRTHVLPRYANLKPGEQLNEGHSTTVTVQEVIFGVLKELTEERRCAFADLVDPAHTVPIEDGNFFYVSYAWLEPFETFVMTILYELGGADPTKNFVYIFHFSDNLWLNAEYGFSSGTSKTAYVVDACRRRHLLILGREASALGRLWCLFEACLSHPGRLTFSLLEGDIHSMVEAVSRVDAGSAAAPDPAVADDMRREIVLRFGSMEAFDLLVRSKLLDVLTRSLAAFDRRIAGPAAALPPTPASALSRLAPPRPGGAAGGGAAAAAAAAPAPARPPAPPAPLQVAPSLLQLAPSGPSSVSAAAVSIRWLLDFYETRVSTQLGPDATTAEVVAQVIRPATLARRCRFYELREAAALRSGDLWADHHRAAHDASSSGSGGHEAAEQMPPLFFVSHAWARPFRRLTDSLRAFLDGTDPSETFVWLDIFAINQHDPLSDLQGGQTLRWTIELSVGTLMVLGADAHPLTRLCVPLTRRQRALALPCRDSHRNGLTGPMPGSVSAPLCLKMCERPPRRTVLPLIACCCLLSPW